MPLWESSLLTNATCHSPLILQTLRIRPDAAQSKLDPAEERGLSQAAVNFQAVTAIPSISRAIRSASTNALE